MAERDRDLSLRPSLDKIRDGRYAAAIRVQEELARLRRDLPRSNDRMYYSIIYPPPLPILRVD
ncbi:hypothetical protein A3H85_01110 [Candidatus Daviesbacteria bacterium RIFCSPLOWO2_02_FULL_40_8]|uniref:Uncharacterized protein n=1 Tax=Candidatus Daviesbacteria bacterium RIFCSPLOWO2_01_FULL_40_24 TaxID=1797787 RepID=A0A1F5MK55_9BACT|nr:MAG: hypothetical protein A2780_02475 [Candidatus Daviesbacteria bacterium RIFCSPHIGHO2_01_FULL_41_45]OGE35044.1 MAG: hypothetical protein A3C32_01350 [Candidatus Daviesbacteria bacterium RIFCSPHIGHO2_02_FULL_41_14]OGE65751.1 MAG: hypothetical protein A3B49_02760 [Candidatus Daviesbacteria bacterium RIFCSPLOWO2_01_FULL_40_24]OGE67072.1 MAG: hypothetical protein A3H85_01110 [Candidatus Daviesbacteria bacterium RIFCSPLOWO2_02_FULL_40_8]